MVDVIRTRHGSDQLGAWFEDIMPMLAQVRREAILNGYSEGGAEEMGIRLALWLLERRG
jgi:hypothetical protein